MDKLIRDALNKEIKGKMIILNLLLVRIMYLKIF